MRKFVNSVKTTFGDPEKTKDEEAEKLGERLKDAHSSCKDHTSAMESMKKAANGMVAAMEQVAKAFTAAAAQNRSEPLEALAKQLTDMAINAKAEASAKYVAALEKDEAGTKKLNEAVDEARRLEEAREKKMKSYDSIRFLVKNKEEEYQKKGKVLEDSKNYKGELAERETKQKEYEEANTAFKAKAEEALKTVDETYLAGMKDFVAATKEMFENFHKVVGEVKV